MPSNAELEKQFKELKDIITEGFQKQKEETLQIKVELSEKIGALTVKVTDFETRLGELEEWVADADINIENINTKVDNGIAQCNESMKHLADRVAALEEKQKLVEETPNDINQMKELIEERTNRQLRETLIFKNIPEQGKESYEKTREILAEVISDNCPNIDYEEAFTQIKRCHREKPKTNADGQSRAGKRHIYSAMMNWYKCQEIIDAFKKKCIDDDNFSVYVDQKYGPLTTRRRSLALKLRKELKEQGLISGGYIKYPAKLYVNVGGEINPLDGRKVYNLHQDFSKADVSK